MLQPITIDLEEKLWLCISVDSLSPSHTYIENSILVQPRSYTLGYSNVVWRCLLRAVGIVCHMATEASQTSPGFELRDQFVVAFCLHRPDANMVSNAACVVQYVTFAFFGNMEDFLRSKSFSHHVCYKRLSIQCTQKVLWWSMCTACSLKILNVFWTVAKTSCSPWMSFSETSSFGTK